MNFISTRSDMHSATFKEAVLNCLPRDGGLYVPSSIVDLRQFFLYMDESTSYPELVETVVPPLLEGDLNPFSAARLAASAFDFEPELKQLDDDFSVLELHNGPTGVFKDFGIAFLAAAMEELLKSGGRAMTLTATSGDTGASIAHSFTARSGITSVILYPEGKVRGLNADHFVQNGGNILPIQIEGNFDDCQRLIREAFEDIPFVLRYGLTSANTLNVGRLLPQAFYYLYAFIKIKKRLRGDLYFSIPSGNFGNLIAALYAWKFGMPVNGFIAAMNSNYSFGSFFRGESFVPRQPIPTISHSMDVGNPSNYERLAAFYAEAPSVMRNMVHPEKVDDNQTLVAMEKAWKKYSLLLDPHGAVAYAAAERMRMSDLEDGHVVILSTGHPAKYADLVKDVTGIVPKMPDALGILSKESQPVAQIPARIDALEAVIAGCC